ncbi:MAG: transglycosylase domain-containing protein, partial [Patescibacteria group bacterium]
FLSGLILGLFLLTYLFILSRSLPSFDEIVGRQISQSTKIYDRESKILLYEISGGTRRTVVGLGDIPQDLKDATIAVEDRTFYDNPSFDWRAIIRALLANLEQGRVVQGGSTITQQLAKNAFLTPERTVNRKIKEVLLALKLSRYYSKDKILELYFNEIPYGPTIYGVGSAAETIFGKKVSELGLAESALLAALPKAPSYYSPWGNHRQELLNRQKLVLKKMREADKITEAELVSALKYKLVFLPPSTGIKAPHFVLAVQDYLIKKYGEDMVRSGGLSVTTTLDFRLQEIAERAVKEGAARNEELYVGKNAALVAQDPRTGQVVAMVGSRDYFDKEIEGNFNVATQGLRQPGSALKPFIYLAAFQKGYTPETILFDVPTEFVSNNPDCPATPVFKDKGEEDASVCFHPQNFDLKFRGPVDLRTALAQSINLPAVKVLYLTGLEDSLKTLQSFGLNTLNNPARYGLSLILGGGEVRLIDLVGAYSVLAQEGLRRAPALVLEIIKTKKLARQ